MAELVTRIDLTGTSDEPQHVEVMTSAGIVRVGTGFVVTDAGEPIVSIEADLNSHS
jgi:hypothetical protein